MLDLRNKRKALPWNSNQTGLHQPKNKVRLVRMVNNLTPNAKENPMANTTTTAIETTVQAIAQVHGLQVRFTWDAETKEGYARLENGSGREVAWVHCWAKYGSDTPTVSPSWPSSSSNGTASDALFAAKAIQAAAEIAAALEIFVNN